MLHNKILKTVLSILVGIFFLYALFRRLDNDEIEAIHTVWKVLFDGQIYKDFFQNHNPFLYYMLTPVIKIFGQTTDVIYVMRSIIFCFALGIGYATYLLAKTITNKTVGLLSAIMLYSLPIITTKLIDIRPDVPMLFCSMLAIALWFVYLKSKRMSSFVASSLLLSASFLFLQKAMFTIFFFGLVMLVQWWSKKVSFQAILLYAGTFLVLPLCYLAYLLATDSLSAYITFAWLFNKYMIGGCPAWPAIRFGLLTNVFWWIAFGGGLRLTIKQKKFWPLIFLFLSLTSVFFVVPYSYSQYLIPALPFAAIITAYGVYIFSMRYERWALPALLLIAIPPIGTNYLRRVIISPVSEQIEKINYVLSITDKDDYVLDSEIGFDGFNLFRKDLDFFWLGVMFTIPSYKRMKPYSYDVYKLIEEKKPKAIGVLSLTKIPKEFLDKRKAYVIEKYYEKSRLYDDVLVRK